jgi:PAS domain S-box-containing protein
MLPCIRIREGGLPVPQKLKHLLLTVLVALVIGGVHAGFILLVKKRILEPSLSLPWLLGIAFGSLLVYFFVSRLCSCVRALSDAKKRYGALFDDNVEAILLLDPEKGTILDANAAASAFYGYSHEQLCSMNISQINPLREHRIRKNLAAAASGKKSRFFFRHRLADGSERPVDVYSSASEMDGRRVLYAIVHDVTERQRMEQELAVLNEGLESQVEQRTSELREAMSNLEREISGRRILERELRLARDEADRANLAKSEFLSWASHELRTPLNAVIGMTNLALDTDLDEEQRSYIESVQLSGNRLVRLVNDILDLSRIEEGRMTLEEERFLLMEPVERVLEYYRSAAEEKGLVLELRTDGALPDAVLGDAFRVEQILNNLVDNAVKFTEKGSVSVSVSAFPKEDGPDATDLVITVSDTGIGIPAEDLPRVFDSYVQLGDSKSRHGAGLGLPVAKRLAVLLGGDISVQSGETGTSFRVEFPLKIAGDSGQPETTPGAVPPKETGGASETAMRVLLAEDEPMNREVAIGLLRNTNWTIDVAEDGEEAVRRFRSATYDLILMDVKMPVMDGLEATRKIRALERNAPKRTPIVAMTAYAMKGDRERCLAAGMDDYLSKPVHREDILRIAGRIASGNGASSDNGCDMPGLSAIARLAGNDPMFMAPILRAFIEVAPAHLAALRECVERNDAAGTEEAAHRLKGQASYFDDRSASEIAARIEASAREGRMENALSDSRALEATMRPLFDLARTFLERRES